MQDRVANALKKYVPDSEATILYLSICKHITSSYMDPVLLPDQRVYRIWYALYMLRGWRKWLLSHKDYTLKDNFITNNAFVCVEINAHALIEIIVKLRLKNQANLFNTLWFSSQPCESMFRMMRSMGTVNFTKINFNLNELLNMIARVEMADKIAHSTKDVNFPKIDAHICNEPQVEPQLPTDQQIVAEMEKARKDALAKLAEFDIFLNANDITENRELQIAKERIANAMMESFSMDEDLDEDPDSDFEEESSEFDRKKRTQKHTSVAIYRIT